MFKNSSGSSSDCSESDDGERPHKRTKASIRAEVKAHANSVAAHLAARFTGLEVAEGGDGYAGADEGDCAEYTRECTGINPTEESEKR